MYILQDHFHMNISILSILFISKRLLENLYRQQRNVKNIYPFQTNVWFLYTPSKHQKISDFLMFYEAVEAELLLEIDWVLS